MNEISKKRKWSVDLNDESIIQCKNVKLIDDKNNQTQKETENDFDFPDMDFDFLEVRQFFCI